MLGYRRAFLAYVMYAKFLYVCEGRHAALAFVTSCVTRMLLYMVVCTQLRKVCRYTPYWWIGASTLQGRGIGQAVSCQCTHQTRGLLYYWLIWSAIGWCWRMGVVSGNIWHGCMSLSVDGVQDSSIKVWSVVHLNYESSEQFRFIKPLSYGKVGEQVVMDWGKCIIYWDDGCKSVPSHLHVCVGVGGEKLGVILRI